MLQNSYISDKKVSKSMTKLNRVSSDNRFRVKSLRIKTEQKLPILQSPMMKKSLQFPSLTKITAQSPAKHLTTSLQNQLSAVIINSKLRVKSCMLQKDYEQQLQSRLGIPRHIVQQLFRLKLEGDHIKQSQEKYVQFCKVMYLRLSDKVEVSVDGFNFRGRALERFLEFYICWKQKPIIGLDLSMCSELAHEVKTKQEEEEIIIDSSSNKTTDNSNEQPLWPKKSLLPRLIIQDPRLTKLCCRNMHISPQQMVDLLTKCLQSQRIYSLDISNKSSQSINRLGTDYFYLEAFFAKNQYIAVLKMDNLSVTDQCLERVCVGVVKNANCPLKILSLSGNLLTEKACTGVYNLMVRVGLTELNLSSNPFNKDFYLSLKNLRTCTLKSLDLSSTSMDSKSLIHLLQQLTQNKTLQILKLDNNDFSHHWFNKVKDVFETGLSIQALSMVNCGIKNFDWLFEGVTHSKYLRRLNINYNLVDVHKENVEKVVTCLKANKTLQELRMRFSGYNQAILCQLLQPLKTNPSIEVLDISQNHMSDNGGKQIIKMLSENKSIKDMGVDKLQFTVKMTQDIHKLIQFNKDKREKEHILQLIDANKICKAKDTMSWSDIEQLTHEAKRIQKAVTESRARNQKIQLKLTQKKQHFTELRKQCKNEEKKMDRDIRHEEIKLSNIVKKMQLEIDSVELKQQQMLQAMQIERNLIMTLQSKIAKENEKIQKREHLLEEQLRDEKYLQKRKEKQEKQEQKIRVSGKTQNQKLVKKNSSQMFDNTKGLTNISKRKNSLSTAKKQ